MKSMGNDETELIARILSGDQGDYRTLVDRYKHPLYRHCFYIVRDEDAAEDMAQEAFIRAYTHLGRFDEQKASFKTWLFTIATRCCLSHLRKNHALPLANEDLLVGTLPSPMQQAQHKEMYAAVRRLRPQHQTAVLLHYWHGYSYEEIATYMDAPVGSVRGWLHRAKKTLKEALS